MKTRGSVTAQDQAPALPGGLPDAAELAALRAWTEGKDTREAVDRYLGDRRAAGESSRGVIGRIRARLASYARTRRRDDVVGLFEGASKRGAAAARKLVAAVEMLRTTPLPSPLDKATHIGQYSRLSRRAMLRFGKRFAWQGPTHRDYSEARRQSGCLLSPAGILLIFRRWRLRRRFEKHPD